MSLKNNDNLMIANYIYKKNNKYDKKVLTTGRIYAIKES